ncbi:MAG: hypothetical protein M9894_13430 [Planctomycetes bacterium]|nr:hypothetical protein [Planctomycetota bacterium]
MRAALVAAALLAAGCATPPAPALPEARLAARAPDARCSACTAPLAEHAREWPDGRVVCAPCHGEAVVDPAEARALLAAARDWLAARFGVTLDPAAALDVRLVDGPTLQAEADDLAHPALQAFSTIAAGEPRAVGGARPLEAVRVTALYGLPRAALRGILVHELFHAHQTARRADPGPPDAAFVEGAAQFVQLRALEAAGAHGWAARLLANEDPVYGGGLRRFRRLVGALGEAQALELGAARAAFPAGY